MFVGHFALGFAAKRIEPQLALPMLLAAPQLLDLLWPLFVLAGVERVDVAPGDTAFTPLRFASYPWSHSLLMAFVWGLGLAAYAIARGTRRRGAVVLLGLVVSHWLLDVASHRPDLPLWPGHGPVFGFGLWRSVPGTLLIEVTIYALGVSLYVRSTRSKNETGRWALAALVAVLLAAYAGAAFGPPPPSTAPVLASSLALWLVPLWGLWIERNRELGRREPRPAGR